VRVVKSLMWWVREVIPQNMFRLDPISCQRCSPRDCDLGRDHSRTKFYGLGLEGSILAAFETNQ